MRGDDPRPENDDPAELARAEALLGMIEAGEGVGAPPSALLAGLDSLLVVAVVSGAEPSELPAVESVEALPEGLVGLAVAAPHGDPVPGRSLVAELAQRLPAGARAAVAVAPGAIGARSLLGPAPDLAWATHRRHAQPGLYLHGSARGLAARPLEPAGQDFRLGVKRAPRRLGVLAGALLAAGLLAALLPVALRPEPPHAVVQLTGERGPANVARGPSSGGLALTEGDLVDLTVRAEPGVRVTLVIFDSQGRLEIPRLEEPMLNLDRREIRQRWELDAHPGTEQVLAVVTREPWPEPDAMLADLNAGPMTSRAARIEALEAALARSLGAQAFRVVRSPEIQHLPR